MEKITLSCSACDAEYTISHNLDEPYAVSVCPFCGEEIEEEIEWGDRWGEFDDHEEYEE